MYDNRAEKAKELHRLKNDVPYFADQVLGVQLPMGCLTIMQHFTSRAAEKMTVND